MLWGTVQMDSHISRGRKKSYSASVRLNLRLVMKNICSWPGSCPQHPNSLSSFSGRQGEDILENGCGKCRRGQGAWQSHKTDHLMKKPRALAGVCQDQRSAGPRGF